MDALGRAGRVERLTIGGLASEVLVGKRITPRLRIKAGLVAYPLLGGRPAVVPVAFGVVSFFR